MGSQVFAETVGYNADNLGDFFDFYVNNTFYLLAPEYYYSFYANYLNRCLSCYDGWVNGWHNRSAGLVPQRALQSIARGLNNMLFAHGIDFSGEGRTYDFATKWAKDSKFYKALKKAHLFAIAGGTSLLKINRSNKSLFATAHRIDTFFADIDAQGKVVSVKVFFDAIHNTNPSGTSQTHYGICEERYFDEYGKAKVRAVVYESSTSLQTAVADRQNAFARKVGWDSLPRNVKTYIKDHYPSIVLDEPQSLPFAKSLGCYLIKFTDDIPQIPNTQFGQPIGDILFTENFQYDQLKYFEKNEVDLARARVLLPEQMWNLDDPNYDRTAFSERFYQKVGTVNGDEDKPTQVQFSLRGEDIRKEKENIFKDIAFKLNISASSVASFLSEGAGAKTATEIVSERTKSDTWIDGQINLNKGEIDDLLRTVMLYYGQEPVEIIFKAENQSPPLETIKTWGDQLTVGNISPELFVRTVHKDLTQEQQRREIELLKEQRALKNATTVAMTEAYKGNTNNGQG